MNTKAIITAITVLIIASSIYIINSSRESINFSKIEELDQKERIEFVIQNKDSIEKEITKEQSLFKNNYPKLLNDYFAVIIGDNVNLRIPNEESGMSTYKDYDPDYGFWFFNTAFFTNANSGIIVYTDKLFSGAYNSTNYLYYFKINNKEVSVNFFRIFDIEQESEKIVEINQKDLEVKNAFYDKEIGMVEISGMRPFGLYPCNENRFFSIFENKLILKKIEVAKACNEKGYEYFNYPISGMPEDNFEEFDFSPIVIYQTPDELFNKIKEI